MVVIDDLIIGSIQEKLNLDVVPQPFVMLK